MSDNTAPRHAPAARPDLWRHWRGLGGWNYYFLLKFMLLWNGYLNFDLISNLIFVAFLLFPLPSLQLHRWRHILAIPVGLGLFYHDTWLPGYRSILSEGTQVAGFSPSYLLDLANRFINWQWVGVAFAMLVAYLFISQWVRVTTFTVGVLAWLVAVQVLPERITSAAPGAAVVTTAPAGAAAPAAAPGAATAAAGAGPAQTLPPTNANLTAYLNQFYDQERARSTAFPAQLPADAQPFDILVINICSLAWADMQAVGQDSSPFWSRFDIKFDSFNSATAYSGPASIRLLRASCGQPSHTDLYKPAGQQCYLFDNLAKLGFTSQLMMDHSGVFGGYIDDLRKEANMQSPLMSQQGIGHEMTSFDGEPIYNDLEILNRWLGTKQESPRSATFFNLIALHDGNRFIGSTQSADYKTRAATLLNQLNTFFDELEKSGRKVMVVFVPEHGAAVTGDKMQMSGLRDIPSPSITHIPAGIRFFGMQAPHQSTPLTITTPSSYLAVSELVARSVDGKIFTAPSVDWSTLTQNLPQTPVVSENANAIVMQYQGKPYIRLNGGDWVPYPQ